MGASVRHPFDDVLTFNFLFRFSMTKVILVLIRRDKV